MDHLLPALALVLVIEGLLLALLPHRFGEALRILESQPLERLRTIGLSAACIGLLIYWMVK